ncbi:hypothetical protein [Acutalibacter sp. 1XD8-36]|uniref:hypothetical protein n=1 Tax=Acutalibacter sp. 1XD8-36 TaxID=2320852 RepID=UPI0014131D84|nr:hypothetical protein [Acutalibacter sp. 1XD8-36]
MTAEQLDRVESALVKNIEYLSERTANAAEVEALAALVGSLASLAAIRQSVQDGQRES